MPVQRGREHGVSSDECLDGQSLVDCPSSVAHPHQIEMLILERVHVRVCQRRLRVPVSLRLIYRHIQLFVLRHVDPGSGPRIDGHWPPRHQTQSGVRQNLGIHIPLLVEPL